MGRTTCPRSVSRDSNLVVHRRSRQHLNLIVYTPGYRAIYGNNVLSPYVVRAVPPIHIIVDHGHVSLESVVARRMDKQIAETRAKSVANVFSVTNNLRVEEQGG